MRRLGAASIVAAVLVFGAAAAATAAPEDQEFTIEQLNAGIVPLRAVIVPLHAQIEPAEKTVREGADRAVVLASDVLFDFGKAELSAAAVRLIGELSADVPQGASARVSGHTDSIGDAASNQELSVQRAQGVADALSAARPDLKLTVEGFGEAQPVEANQRGGVDNPDGRAKNRRVEIRYAG